MSPVDTGALLAIARETYLDSWNAAAPHFDRIIDSFTVQD